MQNSRIKLTPNEAEIVAKILQDHVADRAVWVFGSRIGDNPKPYSDLDLVVTGEKLPAHTLAALNDAFDESDLPFQVDVVEWATTSEAFRRIIAAKYEVIQPHRQGE